MKSITGFNKSTINIIEENEFTEKIGIIYPGQSYYLSAPSLYYLHPIYMNYKIHYFGIDTKYGENMEFMTADPSAKTKWINIDSEMIGEFIKRKTKKYKQKVFVAKSLGTVHLFNQLKQNYIDNKDILIFQTPIMPYTELEGLLHEKGNRSMIIYGTNDYTITKQNFSRIKSNKYLKVCEIENAGHVFEENTNIEKSIDNLKIVMTEMDLFLGKVLD